MVWKPGQSGNLKGKPKGQTPRGKFREQVEGAVPQIVEQLVQNALAGDMQAARMILDRCIPILKATSDSHALKVKAGAGLQEQGQAIIDALHSGELTGEQAKTSMDVLQGQAKLIEQSEILDRLQAVENWLASKK